MSRYVEFPLPDGSTVILETDEPERGVVKAGVGEAVKEVQQTFEEAVENARKAALVILKEVRHLSLHDLPDEVEITFGLKASGELKTLVVARAGTEASYSVRLTWKKENEKKEKEKKPELDQSAGP